jgi:hypothetical protein
MGKPHRASALAHILSRSLARSPGWPQLRSLDFKEGKDPTVRAF